MPSAQKVRICGNLTVATAWTAFFQNFLETISADSHSCIAACKIKRICALCRHCGHIKPEQRKPNSAAVIFRHFAEFPMPPFFPFTFFRKQSSHCEHSFSGNEKNRFLAQKHVHVYKFSYCMLSSIDISEKMCYTIIRSRERYPEKSTGNP